MLKQGTRFPLSRCGLGARPGRQLRRLRRQTESVSQILGLPASALSLSPLRAYPRASPCHASLWAHDRVAFAPSRAKTSPAMRALGFHPRSAPSSPMGLSSALRAVTLRAGRMAGSTTPPTPGRPGSASGCPWTLPIRSGVCRPYAPALRASYYHASSPLFSGSTSSRALMPTSIMESSGSKVVKF